MEKDNSVKFGSTACDYCGEPATRTMGKDIHIVVCDRCYEKTTIRPDSKQASDSVPLKAAAIHLSDQHKK